MLSDKQLDQNATQLTEFRRASTQHQQILANVLEKYTMLMEDYKRLKSDYEEERDSRERYKQMARGQERNPFVLVLVDGDGYIFDDDLVSNGAEGGQRAAQLLDDAVKRSLRTRGLDHCRIMVRVYANLVGLSRALSKHKLCGAEKRSLAPFAANFTRSNDLFDFIDAGELKENADSKIKALFRQFADNAQCRHIYFAGCHDVGYLNELQPYTGNRERITLVRTPAFHPEFGKLGMRVEDFHYIFRATPLEGDIFHHRVLPLSAPAQLQSAPKSDNMMAKQNDAQVCFFFQKGLCKYGKTCHNLHVKQSTNGSFGSAIGNLNDIKKWRDDTGREKASLPFHLSNIAKSDNDVMSGNAGTTPSHDDPIQNQIDFATKLPQANKIPSNVIPLNKNNHRLDAYIPPPSPQERAAFTARVAMRMLCNNHHINSMCPKLDTCDFDHNPATPEIINCLRQVVTNNPCPRKGGCRLLTCLNGDICQKADCKFRGGKFFCKFGVLAHAQDLNVLEYFPGVAPKSGELPNEDSSEMAASVSGRGSTPPAQQTESWPNVSTPMEGDNGWEVPSAKRGEWEAESDGPPREEEEKEGALLDREGTESLD